MQPLAAVYRFGPFTLDAAAYRLLRGDETVTLTPKAIDLLLCLVARPSTLITKEELFRQLWPDVTVTENALTQTVSDVRQALGDRASSPRYIQTVTRRGYRFIAPVETVSADIAVTEAAAVVSPQYVGRLRRSRETTSLEAYRAFTEGRLRLEALDATTAPDAIRDFERAIELDPEYSLAYVGLANAYFWIYEASRDRLRPDTGAQLAAVSYAQRAAEIDPELAETHATLSYVLVSAGRPADALASARRAVALEPGYWGHHFRLGNASWGSGRLQALAQALALYPDFPYAHYQMAMVHIARGALDAAEGALRSGGVIQDRQAGRRERFPARGLHWLLGLTCLARGNRDAAVAEFDREIAAGGTHLYSHEYVMASWLGRGLAVLEADVAASLSCFDAALALAPDHPRARLARSLALERTGNAADAAKELDAARASMRTLHDAGRASELALVSAFDAAIQGDADAAITSLTRLLDEPAPAHVGWTIPLEPWLRPLAADPRFVTLLRRLADRAR
jgi:DNA-binding winged helix-turn-helix (wHTH) protein